MARVVVLGSSNTDMTVRLPRLPVPGETRLGGEFLSGFGGKGANQAVAARRAGADVMLLTAVGDDLFGRRLLDHYRRERIDLSHVLVVPGTPSGVALIFVDEAGENLIGVASGANGRLDAAAIDRLPDSVFEDGGVLLAGLEVPLETVERAVLRARAAGMQVILNPAPVDGRLLDRDILSFVDILTPNRIEACALAGLSVTHEPGWAGLAVDALRKRGAGDVVITAGKDGCLLAEAASSPEGFHSIRAFPVEAVDTVGAGDAFNGALATAIAEGRSRLQATIWATAAAAIAVTQSGAQSALANRDAIDRLAATYEPD